MQNRELPQLDDLYKEIILEHYRSPHGRVPVEKIDYKASGMNPLCGDEVELCLQMDNGKIKRVHLEGHGCSISTASGSMLAQILEGKTIDEAKECSRCIKEMMKSQTDETARRPAPTRVERGERDGESASRPIAPSPHRRFVIDIGDLEALEGVKKFPVRIKCALLPWTTFEEALMGHEHVEIS